MADRGCLLILKIIIEKINFCCFFTNKNAKMVIAFLVIFFYNDCIKIAYLEKNRRSIS